jgi:hypothetical protein
MSEKVRILFKSHNHLAQFMTKPLDPKCAGYIASVLIGSQPIEASFNGKMCKYDYLPVDGECDVMIIADSNRILPMYSKEKADGTC